MNFHDGSLDFVSILTCLTHDMSRIKKDDGLASLKSEKFSSTSMDVIRKDFIIFVEVYNVFIVR